MNALKKLIKDEDPLSPMIMEFNFQPARYAAPDRVSGLIEAPLFEKLRRSPRAERRLSAWMLGELGLDGQYWFDFTEEHRRIALMDGRTLIDLVFFAGAAVNARWISRVIDKERSAALRRNLGDRVLGFALKRAPLLLGDSEFSDAPPDELTEVKAHVEAAGKRCLEACFAGEPAALTRRLLLKFPTCVSLTFDRAASPEEKAAAGRVIRKIACSEGSPVWTASVS